MAQSTKSVSRLESHLGYWLRFVSNHVSHSFMQKVESRGVTVAEWVVLRELLEVGEMRPSDLAQKIGMTRGAISKLVERLCVKKLVARQASSSDGRVQQIELTAQGKRLVPMLAKLADENDQQFFGHLTSEERQMLHGLLQSLVKTHGWKELPVE